jgi:DNA-binding PadR family transcriptional regulator
MAREKLQTLTEPMYYILLALTEACCGVDIMNRVLNISKGRVTVGPGTLYALLGKFEKSGIIKETEVDGRKRTYILTDNGKEILKEEYNRLVAMAEEGKSYMGGLL